MSGQTMSEEDQQELREIWTLFSELSCRARQVQDDSIATSELITVLRALGQNPSHVDVQQLQARADPYNTGSITFQNFLSLAAGTISNPEQEITEAFRVFDRDGKAKLPASEFRHIMTNLGEKFSDEDVDEMLREAGVVGDGDIAYEEFARKITAT